MFGIHRRVNPRPQSPTFFDKKIFSVTALMLYTGMNLKICRTTIHQQSV